MTINVSEVFSEAKPILENVCPSLRALLSSSSNISSNIVLSLLGAALGTNPSDISGIVNTILTDPTVEAKLVDLETRFINHFVSIL